MNDIRKPNILEFCLSSDLGGLELFMLNCYEDFKTKTNCSIIIAPNKKLDNYIQDNNKSYIKRNKLFPIIPAIKLAKFIDNNNIDIVHFHWTKDITTIVLAKKLSKKKFQIIQTRNMTMTRFKSDFYHKWLYKNIHTMHAVTYQVKDQLIKFIPSDIRPNINVIYMGTKEKEIKKEEISILKQKYNLNNEFIVGIVGRIEDGKGQYLVIEAIDILNKTVKNINMKAIIVGHTMDEEYLNNIKQKVKTLDIEDKVIFTGFTKDVDAHMHIFDCNILATPKETFGLVVIEAMINKVCMIATNNGGPLEIINNNKDGLLFNRTSNDLADKIKLLYNNKEYKDTLSLAGYNKAKKIFNKDIQNNKLYKMIEGINI